MAEALLLGIDIGTASSKAVITDADGRVVATARREHVLSLPHPGWAEQDADTIWWADVVALLDELRHHLTAVAAVCVSGLGPCLLPADADGRPLRPAILYGIDTRATREIEELTETLGLPAILARGGSSLSAQAVGPKLLWLRRHEPEIWARTRRFFMPSSYVVHRLTGAYVLDHHSASQCDPLYDLDAAEWATDWASEIAAELELPRLSWSHEVVGEVTAEAAELTGLPRGTPVCAGTIDAWAEAHSAGVREVGDFMLMYGSTMFMLEVVEWPARNELVWSTAGCLPGSLSIAGGLATSGSLTAWLREIAGGTSYEVLVDEARRVAPGAEGLVALPYFAGERTPIYDPDARGVIAGLTLRHGRGHLYRCLLEATAFALRHSLEAFDAISSDRRRIVPVGGGTAGELWMRIVSDVIRLPQEVPAVTIGAAYGDCLLAAQASGAVAMDGSWARTDRVVEPDDAAAAAYEGLYDVYRELGAATHDIQHALAAVGNTAFPGAAG